LHDASQRVEGTNVKEGTLWDGLHFRSDLGAPTLHRPDVEIGQGNIDKGREVRQEERVVDDGSHLNNLENLVSKTEEHHSNEGEDEKLVFALIGLGLSMLGLDLVIIHNEWTNIDDIVIL
jgi:hypothetical protein